MQHKVGRASQMSKSWCKATPTTLNSCSSSAPSSTSGCEELEKEPQTLLPNFQGSYSLSTEYPPEVVIHNTFLEIRLSRPASLQAFLHERNVLSAPGACAVHVDTKGVEHNKEKTCTIHQKGKHGGLDLSVLLPEPEVSSAGPPRAGSVKRGFSQCMPDAFVWHNKGYCNGGDCAFCHLCEAGERRRQAKEQKARNRSVHAGLASLQQMVRAGVNRFVA